MRELMLEQKEIVGEQKGLRCRYSILVDEVPTGRFFCEVYGVKIEEEGTGERAEFPGLTVSAERIDELVELLIRNEVTPAGLPDVIADWMQR